MPVGCTLVVVPQSLIAQWENEIRTHTCSMQYAIYHGCGSLPSDALGAATTTGSPSGLKCRRSQSNTAVQDSSAEIQRPCLASIYAEQLFTIRSSNLGSTDAAAGEAGTPDAASATAVPGGVGECQIILASYGE